MELKHTWPDDVEETVKQYRGEIPDEVLDEIVAECEPLDFDDDELEDALDAFCEDVVYACDTWIEKHGGVTE